MFLGNIRPGVDKSLTKVLVFFAVVLGVGKCFLQLTFKCKSTFKSKWKRFWIIRLKIWAKIEVTKHVLLADEFIPHRLIAEHLFVNAMKCVHVRFPPSKQQ